jgi:cytochrome c biogenesis protein CcmG, thiol:disulfide interchange protein DsbE
MSVFLAIVLLAAPGDELPEMIPLADLPTTGKKAADFELPLFGGGTFKLSEARGKPVILSFWASWCGPCREELPELNRFADSRKDVVVVAVNTDRNRSAGERFYKQLKLTLPAVYDQGSVALSQFDVETFPTTYVIDQKGTVVLRSAGYNKRYKLKPLVDFVNRLVRRR